MRYEISWSLFIQLEHNSAQFKSDKSGPQELEIMMRSKHAEHKPNYC